jgi:Right handed beta helix region/Secretion system C-terminal sorting domain
MKRVLLTVCLLVVFAGVGTAQPTISGAQSGTLGPGEYIVIGDLSIDNGSTLTIEPGTTFLFDGSYNFRIPGNSTLIAQGTETDSIKFMPNTGHGVTQWEHLIFEGTGSEDVLSYCLITGGDQIEGGAIRCLHSSPTINNCVLRGNSANDGGAIFCYESSPMIINTVIAENSARFGAGIQCRDLSSPTFKNCTITGNTSSDYGGGFYCDESSPTIVNTAITNNIGEGVYARDTSSPSIECCDIYNNSGGDFGGNSIDPNFGVIVGTNFSGDPCDLYSNISMDPLYVDPGNGDYNLQEDSPCIDAGDPHSDYDPDHSYADIGAFYYHHEGFFLAGDQYGFLGPGTFIVTGHLSIPECEALTIMPGTTLLFDGPYTFTIGQYRTLICEGTETDSIEFRPNTDNGITQWGHLKFDLSSTDDILEYCLITGGYDAESGGGIYCYGSSPIIRNCTIKGNSSGDWGGGIALEGSPDIINCTIIGNHASEGSAIHCAGSNPLIRNCTIDGNTGAEAIYAFYSSPIIENTTITNNNGGFGQHDYHSDASIRNCNFYGNTHGNFYGSGANPNWGVIVGENVNGDQCDLYSNIFMDPRYLDRDSSDYRLEIDSPCIDAGNPNLSPDPDGTVSDQGAFYYDQTNGRITISLEPVNPPVQIGAGGGVFAFSATLTNLALNQFTFDAWTEAVLPNGGVFGPIDTFTGITFPGEHSVSPNLTQGVPGLAPVGTYMFRANVGVYPDIVVSSDEFEFEKLATAGTMMYHEWSSTGWNLAHSGLNSSVVPESVELLTVYPNPFNPSTTISVALSNSSELQLSVYNTLGQHVVLLADGYHVAGSHTYSMDGSKLASGIYFVQAKIDGQRTVVKKVMLVR